MTARILLPALLLLARLAHAEETRPDARQLPSPPDAGGMQRLLAGEVLFGSFYTTSEDGDPKGVATGSALVNAPVEQVWKCIRDAETYDEYFHSITETRVIRSWENREWVHYLSGLSVFAPEFDLIHHYDDTAHLMRYEMDTSQPATYFKSLEGFWHLTAMGEGRTLAVYRFAAEVDFPLLGWLIQPIVESMAESSMPKVLGALRSRAESGGAWRKEDVVAVNPIITSAPEKAPASRMEPSAPPAVKTPPPETP